MNPFVYNRPVAPDDLVDRDAEARLLLELAEGGHATRLMAPRRYGKTSLLGRLLRDADLAGMQTVRVDFFGIVSLQDVAIRLENAYRRGLQGRARRAAVAALRATRPDVRASGPAVSVGASLEPEQELLRVVATMLDLPIALFERTGRRTLVVFDEFQALLGARHPLDGLIRSHIQHHGEAASYVFAGSEPSLMRELFASRERPLYGQARPIELHPLPDAELTAFLDARFTTGRRDPGDALEPLLDLVRGHPQRAMLAAHHLWEAIGPGARATAETWERVRAAVLAELEEPLQVAWSGLERRQRAVLSALALGGDTLYSRRTLERFELTKGTARSARDRLVDVGEHLREGPGGGEFVDPLFAAWIREFQPR